jgi:ribosomal protein S18 acetylase RimI-like enzyme
MSRIKPIIESEIAFAPVEQIDFEDFKSLRKLVILPHIERQGLVWDEASEDKYHRELFDAYGLRVVSYKGLRIGYIDVRYDPHEDHVVVGRICLMPAYQSMGICSGKKLFLDVLLMNPASRLYERLGFVKVREDEKLAYYERLPNLPSMSQIKKYDFA